MKAETRTFNCDSTSLAKLAPGEFLIQTDQWVPSLGVLNLGMERGLEMKEGNRTFDGIQAPGFNISWSPKTCLSLSETQHPYQQLTCLPKLNQGRFHLLAAEVILSNTII